MELLFIWAMLHSFNLNTVFFLAKQIIKVAKAQKGVAVMGGLITPIVVALGINPYGIEQAKGNSKLDIESYVSIKMVVREGDIYCLMYKSSNFTLPLPNQERTMVRNKSNWKLRPEVGIDDEAIPLDTTPPSPSS